MAPRRPRESNNLAISNNIVLFDIANEIKHVWKMEGLLGLIPVNI